MRERTATAPDGYPVHGWVTVAAGARPAPGAADHPRRPVRAVRLDAVRRDPGLRLGRLRRRAVQSARVVRLRRGARAGDQGRLRRARRRRRAGLPRRRADRPGARRRPGRRHGRLLRRLPDHAPDRPHARGSRPAISERAFIDPVSFVGSSDIGWFFPDQYLGTDPDAAGRAERAGRRARRSPRRRWSSTPRRTGAARWSRARGSTSSSSAAACPSELLLFPGEGHELSRSGRPRHRLARLEHVLRWWARLAADAAEPRRGPRAVVGVPAGRPARRPSSAEPLSVRATRVD